MQRYVASALGNPKFCALCYHYFPLNLCGICLHQSLANSNKFSTFFFLSSLSDAKLEITELKQNNA